MVGVVGVFEVQVVHFHERLAESKTPRQNRLDVHAVHGDVSSTEGYLRGVAAEREVRRMGHILVAVFLGIDIGVACKSEFKRNRVGNQSAEVESEGVSAKGGSFPVEVGNGAVDGNSLAFLEQDSVFAVQSEGRGVIAEACGEQSRQLAWVAGLDRAHAHVVGVEFRCSEDRGTEQPFGFLSRNVVGALHDFAERKHPAAGIGFAGGRVDAPGGLVDAVLRRRCCVRVWF